jgi:hypothetical protein
MARLRSPLLAREVGGPVLPVTPVGVGEPENVPDTDANRCWLGKLKPSLGVTGYPVVRLMTLVETGTRAMLGAVFGAAGDRGNRLRAAPVRPARRGHAWC